ncbi:MULTISPECIES: hypothetical protein [unclassified Variovorax]|uniref:hypothetical protein n=1 Tax=unclassified Variovorax TaxID=663243 RepID=UPI000837BFEE|nr:MULTISPECIES: hypothetical protein [unclassified Variovorax]PNG58889.1 hypothetical protein CHC07_00614 [Variovorax sp. B4]PNG61321.1 hypothetical protein CHC06_01222 [Variovorax sp. B2]VTV12686.1 hypothetical protein WDL1CHR_03443 [Variovorax sp. WDL1]
MATDNVKSPAELADEAQQTARDALEAAKGYAQESGRISRDAAHSIRSTVEDVRETGGEALDTVRGLSHDAADIARSAGTAGRVYARKAVGATGRKLRDWQGQVDEVKESCTRYIANEPVRSTLIAAGGGALLMTLLLSMMKRRRHYET